MQCRPHRRSLGSNAWILRSATEPIAGRAHRKTRAMDRTVAASASIRQTSVTKTQVPCLVGGGLAPRLKGCLTSGEASARWRNLMLAYRLDSLLGTSIPRTNGVFWMTESAPRPSGSIAVALSRAAGICRAPIRPANSQPSAINFPPGKTSVLAISSTPTTPTACSSLAGMTRRAVIFSLTRQAAHPTGESSTTSSMRLG